MVGRGWGRGVSEKREEKTLFLCKLFNFVRNVIGPYVIPDREKSYDYNSL
jgi:hypothetical protein